MYRIGQEEKDAVARVIDSGYLFKVNKGPLQETRNFEQELKEKVGTDHAILMTSGHAALTSGLVGMGVGPGDEVLVPAYTYIATAMAVVAVGAVPVIAEVDDSLMMDPAALESKITPRTKAIIPVHMRGFPCDMDGIMAVAEKHNLLVLEDACQAMGGTYKGRPLGSIGHAGAYSFNYFKIISAGEGGALVTNDKTIFERALIYHDSSAVAFFGNQMEDFTTETFCGTEMRTNEITAAILREQLKKLDGIVADLRTVRQKLADLLAPRFECIPSNDAQGDPCTTMTLKFKTSEEADRFAERCPIKCNVAFHTGKHVYTAWTPILEKRGALHPELNPFNLPANSFASYDPDCCLKSLEYLKRAVNLELNPDWTDAELQALADQILAEA